MTAQSQGAQSMDTVVPSNLAMRSEASNCCYILELCAAVVRVSPTPEVTPGQQGLTVSHAQLQHSWSRTSSQASQSIWYPCALALAQLLLPAKVSQEAVSVSAQHQSLRQRPVTCEISPI